MSENTIAQINEPVLEFGQNLIELIVDGVPYRVGVTEEELRRIQYSDTAYEHYQEIMEYWEGDGDSNIGLKREAENARDHANAFAKMISGEVLTAEEEGYLSAAQQAVHDTINGNLKGLLAKYKTEVVDPWNTLKTGTIEPKVDFMEKRADSVEDFIDAFAEALNKITLNVVPSGENSNVLNFDMTKPILTLSKNEDGTIESSANATEVQTLGTFNLDVARIPSDSYYSGSDMIVSYIYTDESTPTNFRYTPVYCKHVISNFNKQITDGDFWNIGYGKTSVSPNTSGATISNEIRSNKLFAALGNSGSAATVNIAFNPFTVDNVSKVVGTKGFLYTQTGTMPTSGWAATSTTRALVPDIKRFEQTANMNFKIKPNFDSNNGKYTGAVTVTPAPYLPSLSVPTKTGAVCGFEAYIYYVAGNVYFMKITFNDLSNLEKKRPTKMRFAILRSIKELSANEISAVRYPDSKPSDSIFVTFPTNSYFDVSITGTTTEKELNLDHVSASGDLYYYYPILVMFDVDTDGAATSSGKKLSYYTGVQKNTIINNAKMSSDFAKTYNLATANYNLYVNYDWPLNMKRIAKTVTLPTLANYSPLTSERKIIGRTTGTNPATSTITTPSSTVFTLNESQNRWELTSLKMLSTDGNNGIYKYYTICPPGFWLKNSTFNNATTHTLDIKYPYRNLKIVILVTTQKDSVPNVVKNAGSNSAWYIHGRAYANRSATADSGIDIDSGSAYTKDFKSKNIDSNTKVYRCIIDCSQISCYEGDLYTTAANDSERINRRIFYDFQLNQIESQNNNTLLIGTDGKYYKWLPNSGTSQKNNKRARMPMILSEDKRNQSFVAIKKNEQNQPEVGPLVIFEENDDALVIFNLIEPEDIKTFSYITPTDMNAANISNEIDYKEIDLSNNQIVKTAYDLAIATDFT